MAKVNGNDIDFGKADLLTYLEDAGYEASKLAVEVNGKILPKKDYEGFHPSESDNIEIVNFVGGG